MFTTKAVVIVKTKDGKKIAAQQEYDKVVLHGTTVDKDGNVVILDEEGAPVTDATKLAPIVERLLSEAIAYKQNKAKEGANGVIEMLKDVTYGDDLDVRAKIRRVLEQGLEGPEKAIEAQVKAFMAARASVGKPVSEAFARKKVMASLEDEEGDEATA